jgi:tRNA G18 (ribose-2'-O)-methylase SpoU
MNENRKLRIEHAEKNRVLSVCLIVENLWYEHNISAIFRTMECSGLKNIFVVGNITKKKLKNNHIDFKCSKFLNVIYFEKIEDAINEAKKQGFKVYATCMSEDSEHIWQADFKDKIAVVMGTEKTGVSDKVLELCDKKIWIPMFGLTRSLNVSVSAAVIIYEILRKKRYEYNEISNDICAPFMKFPGERN